MIPIDEFKTVTFRLDRSSRAASCDFAERLHYGDDLKLVFTGVSGIDQPSAEVALFPQTIATTTSLGSGGTAGSFSFVEGRTDAIYCTLSLLTVPLKALVDAVTPGTPVTVRLYLADSEKTWLDTDIDIYPSPIKATYSPATAGDRYVTLGDLDAVVAAVQAMPTLTAADREARFNALLTRLGGIVL